MVRPKGTKNIVLHMWTDEEKEYFKEIVPGHGYKEIQELMNKKFDFDITLNQIKGAIRRYKLNTGITGRFTKGHTPSNKGTKGLTSANSGSFKKGQPPTNYRPVGSERLNRDGYTEVKIKEPDIWKSKQKMVWEKGNGPIPKGCVITFGDGNIKNFDINNLILVTKGQLLIMNRNGLKKDDMELTKIGLNIAKVYEKINERKKGNEDRR